MATNTPPLLEQYCPKPRTETAPQQQWTAADNAARDNAVMGCSRHFGLDAPCLISIKKTAPNTYHVTCGKGR